MAYQALVSAGPAARGPPQSSAAGLARSFSDGSRGGLPPLSSAPARPLRNLRREPTREQGVVIVIKEAFGFIKCAEREEELFFHFNDFPGQATARSGTEVVRRPACTRNVFAHDFLHTVCRSPPIAPKYQSVLRRSL